MNEVGGTIATAVAVFAGTNVDDIVVLTVLFLAARSTGKPASWQIWVGQYAGIAALVAASGLAAAGLAIVPDRWVGLLGFIPFALGVRGLVTTIRFRQDGDEPDTVVAGSAFAVAGITIANGADNISRYGHWIVPVVFMLIGAVIVVESGVLGHLADLM